MVPGEPEAVEGSRPAISTLATPVRDYSRVFELGDDVLDVRVLNVKFDDRAAHFLGVAVNIVSIEYDNYQDSVQIVSLHAGPHLRGRLAYEEVFGG